MLPGARQGLHQHQHGAHRAGLPQVELSVLIARLDPEGVDGIGVDAGGLDLEDVGGHGPVGADAHVLVHHRVGQLPANGVGHRAHAAVLRGKDVGLLTRISGVTTEPSVVIPADFILSAFISGLTLIDILACPASYYLVPFRAHAGELSWLVDTLVLT